MNNTIVSLSTVLGTWTLGDAHGSFNISEINQINESTFEIFLNKGDYDFLWKLVVAEGMIIEYVPPTD